VAITTGEKGATASTEMGRKSVVPYGLYRQEGYISANLARAVTGFSEADLEAFWQAVIHMFDDDRSAAHGKMALRELIVFKHDSPLGGAPAHKLFERVNVRRKADVPVARAYGDYDVTVDGGDMPAGVTLLRLYRDDA
jgi:CRISPR-associated protein Csd2